MGRSKNILSAMIVSFAVVLGLASTVHAQSMGQSLRQDSPPAQKRTATRLTLPEKADILNRMAIHNARKGNLSGAARFFLKSFHASRIARDKRRARRARRAIANLKRLEKKFGKAAILGHKKVKPKKSPARKPYIYNMPDWRTSREA